MITKEQIIICEKYGAEYQPVDPELKVGVSDNFFSEVLPLNGLRHPPEKSTCGWYLWAGEEMSEADDFFKPMHVYHLIERCPNVVKYLALPPGWRFLLAGEHEDVWFNANLLDTYPEPKL